MRPWRPRPPGLDQSPSPRERYQEVWSLSDESLLAGLVAGVPEHAAAFVRRFQSRVYGLTLAILGDPEAAEEAAQETFVRAWRYGGGYDPRRGRVATWLLTIARHVATDAARMGRGEPMDPDRIVQLNVPAADAEPEEQAIALEEGRKLRQALAALPAEQRRALVQAAFLGRTAREIGESEGIPLGTAKTRIRAAMLKLRSVLETSDER
ncbi:MAG TPA: sigma-70 family RNA polymerase sigma factor [Actinomycetota bacterium]|nr:sigma-70 family RNA polymerase sigma factor [Actinomycetota bacterium]